MNDAAGRPPTVSRREMTYGAAILAAVVIIYFTPFGSWLRHEGLRALAIFVGGYG